MGTGRAADDLAFSAGGRRILVEAWHDGCMGVRVTVDGAAQPALQGADAIDQAVRAVLGLPSAYQL